MVTWLFYTMPVQKTSALLGGSWQTLSVSRLNSPRA